MEIIQKSCAGVYRYGFNGKEEDSAGEWGSKSHYDYGFRIYNPSIGKFLSVDPLAKEYPELTPYQYASNTPIQAIDLDGLEAFPFYATPFFTSPGGQIIQKAIANAIYVAANRNFTEVKGQFSSDEIKALQANPTKNSYLDFTERIKGFGISEVKHMNDLPRFGVVKSEVSAAGPLDEIRYIKDPGNPQVTLDMRHFMVIGGSVPTQTGAEIFGFGVEVIQDFGAQKSAYDIQDYYSNQLGAEFFNKHYDSKSKSSLSEQLNTFFQSREAEYKVKSESKSSSNIEN